MPLPITQPLLDGYMMDIDITQLRLLFKTEQIHYILQAPNYFSFFYSSLLHLYHFASKQGVSPERKSEMFRIQFTSLFKSEYLPLCGHEYDEHAFLLRPYKVTPDRLSPML